MSESEIRWPCPVCLGTRLKKLRLEARTVVVVDACPRCRGVWFEGGEIEAVEDYHRAALLADVSRQTDRIGCGAAAAKGRWRGFVANLGDQGRPDRTGGVWPKPAVGSMFRDRIPRCRSFDPRRRPGAGAWTGTTS